MRKFKMPLAKLPRLFFALTLTLLLGLVLAACSATTATPTVSTTTTPSTPSNPVFTPTMVLTENAVVTTQAPATTVTTIRPPIENTPIKTNTPTLAVSLRQVDWLAVLKADPLLNKEADSSTPGIRVSLKKDSGIEGLPDLKQIVYVDLDGDKQEEAALPLSSGGSAGTVAFLVYRQASPNPQLVGWGYGDKLSLSAENGQLVVCTGIYNQGDAGCCPSSSRYVNYVLKNNQLVKVAERTEANQATIGNDERGQINPAFKNIVPQLKAQTKLPVLLPTLISTKQAMATDKTIPYYGILKQADSTSYEVLIADTPQCDESNACYEGSIKAELANPKDIAAYEKDPTYTKVKLASGNTGYFVPAFCAASCVGGQITWQQAGVSYIIRLKNNDVQALAVMATSAIRSGVL